MAVIRKSRISAIAPRLQTIGKLFKGTKKQTNAKGKEIQGKDLDYFRFEPEERLKAFASTNGEFNNLYDELLARWADLKEEFGDYRSIPVLLPFSTMAENFLSGNARWATNGKAQQCIQRCDGDYMSQWQESGKGVVRGVKPCAMKEGDRECPLGCKAEGTLSVIIPALGYPGIVQLTTHSGKEIRSLIPKACEFWESKGYDLSKIPMRLTRSLLACDWHKPDGSIVPQKKYLVSLEVDPQYGLAALNRQQQLYHAEIMGGVAAPALTGSPTGNLAIAPAKVAQRYDETMEWFDFQRSVQASVRANDLEVLNEWHEWAIDHLPVAARTPIDRLVDDARSMIVSSSHLAIKAKPQATAAQQRIAEIAKLTGYVRAQLVEIAQKADLPESSATYTDAQAQKFVDAVLVDWAMNRGLGFENACHILANTEGDDKARLEELILELDEISLVEHAEAIGVNGDTGNDTKNEESIAVTVTASEVSTPWT
jgi:Recombination directionality factor-like